VVVSMMQQMHPLNMNKLEYIKEGKLASVRGIKSWMKDYVG